MKAQFPALNKMSFVIACSRAIRISAISAFAALTLCPFPTLAKDPFRPDSKYQISAQTEAAFKALFEQGNYPQAKIYLQQAEASDPNEPMVYALRASLGYLEQDLEGLKSYSDKALEKAKQLNTKDPLRGNIYTAVAYFLKGAYSFEKEGAFGVLGQLQQVFQYLDEAKKIAPDDPELNLIKGYMDLMLAVNLPFSDPAQAIDQLQKYGKPQYLSNRGIAIGYRDLKQYTKAQEYVDKALKDTPNNPEVNYLKAQVLVNLGKKQEAQAFFNNALAKSPQLPKMIVSQIFYEQCKNQRSIDNKNRDCRGLRNTIRQNTGSWGPSTLPPLN